MKLPLYFYVHYQLEIIIMYVRVIFLYFISIICVISLTLLFFENVNKKLPRFFYSLFRGFDHYSSILSPPRSNLGDEVSRIHDYYSDNHLMEKISQISSIPPSFHNNTRYYSMKAMSTKRSFIRSHLEIFMPQS